MTTLPPMTLLAALAATHRALRAKLFELRRTPSAWWLVTATVVYALTVVLLLLALLDVPSWDEAGLRALLASAGGSGALMVLFGVVQAAGEYRHRTIVPLTLAEPRRTPALAGQLLAYAAAGLLAGFIATTVSVVAAYGGCRCVGRRSTSVPVLSPLSSSAARSTPRSGPCSVAGSARSPETRSPRRSLCSPTS